MIAERVFVGGWFQRTALHLSEFYDFLNTATSPLKLDPGKLKELHGALAIEKIEWHTGDLEYVELFVRNDITVRIYEDGLIFLARTGDQQVAEDVTALTTYYEQHLSPAFSYLFSLGAPVPKELANIKTVYPYFMVLDNKSAEDAQELLTEFNQEGTLEVHNKGFDIYRGDKLYVINRKKISLESAERFAEEQIFLREFRGQMHRYLNIHRIIWEEIAEVKERGKIRGRDISDFKNKIDSYKKTITLIDGRISQMDAYLHTRESIAKSDPELTELLDIIEYRYETLANTLDYIKDIWKMTQQYVDSALHLFTDLQAQSTQSSVQNLTIVTSVGVGATLIGLFTSKTPTFTSFGVLYFALLVVVGWSATKILKWYYQRKQYEIGDPEAATNIR